MKLKVLLYVMVLLFCISDAISESINISDELTERELNGITELYRSLDSENRKTSILDLIENMVNAYAELNSYHDKGKITVHSKGGQKIYFEAMFETFYIKEKGFKHIQYLCSYNFNPSNTGNTCRHNNTHAVWGNKGLASRYISKRIEDRKKSTFSNLYWGHMPNKFVRITAPGYLLGIYDVNKIYGKSTWNKIVENPVSSPTHFSIADDKNNHKILRIERNKLSVAYWINMETFLIEKIEGSDSSYRWEAIYNKIEPNTSVSIDDLSFKPTKDLPNNEFAEYNKKQFIEKHFIKLIVFGCLLIILVPIMISNWLIKKGMNGKAEIIFKLYLMLAITAAILGVIALFMVPEGNHMANLSKMIAFIGLMFISFVFYIPVLIIQRMIKNKILETQ